MAKGMECEVLMAYIYIAVLLFTLLYRNPHCYGCVYIAIMQFTWLWLCLHHPA